MKRYAFTLTALAIALVFWFFDASVHYLFYDETEFEFIPSDFNELWMRVVIETLIIVFGLFSDYYSNRLVKQQQQLEAVKIYDSMLRASHHILNNLLNQMQLIRMEASRCQDFDSKVLKHYDNAIDEASNLIQRLSAIEKITDENILASVDPDKVLSDKSLD